MTDDITVLRCARGLRLAKKIGPAEIIDYDATRTFDGWTVAVDSLEDIHKLITRLIENRRLCVLFTHLNAFGTGTSALAYHGVPYLRGYAEALGNLLRAAKNDDEYRYIVDTVGAGIEGTHGAAMAPGWVGDDLPGTLSKISHHYFQLTGLSPMLRAVKDGVAFTMSRSLALAKDTEWNGLSPEMRNSLNMFGFTPEEWDVLRAAPGNPTYHGKEHLTPDAALRSTADLSPEERSQLTNKLAAYYSSIADEYTITPTMLDKHAAQLFTSFDPNSIGGQVMRFVAQFKQWPAAALRQGIGRETLGRKQIGGKLGGLTHLILATTALGYLRMVLGDLSQGKVPPEPSPKTFVAAMAQGGGLGIFGDFLFGQENRFGQSLPETIAGPVLGEGAQDLLTIWNSVRDAALTGDETKLKDLPSETVRMAVQNMPFANLFYVRGALNYLLLDSLQESLNPGYLERSQAAQQRNEGVAYMAPWTPILGIFNPQSHLHTFGQ